MSNITAEENSELVLEMQAMERTTPAHYDEWNRRYQQFLNNDKFLNEQIKNTFVKDSNAGFSNSIYREKDLTDVYTIDEICNRINSGTFEDLYIGDYFDVSITTEYGGRETVSLVLAGFDIFLNRLDSTLKNHHAVIIPKDCFKTSAKMNDTSTTTGGYKGTKMHKTVLPVYASALQSVLNNHIISHKELITVGISTTGNSNAGAGEMGYACEWMWENCLLRLMSEVQLYGSTVYSSSFYDIGSANIQFPLFRLAPYLKVAGLGHNGSLTNQWLSAVVSTKAFASCHYMGSSNKNNADEECGVRPYFCIG